jgi:cyclase
MSDPTPCTSAVHSHLPPNSGRSPVLVDLQGGWAYLQPHGEWGRSNAGLITDSGHALLVDTLFDRPHTAEMLRTMADATGVATRQISTVINTHANGDHTYGNGLLPHAEIVASLASAQELARVPPSLLAEMMHNTSKMGATGAYLNRIFGEFEFENNALRAPTRTFCGRLSLQVGAKQVDLYEVGPAHTKGDVIVHDVCSGIVYTGDILFIDSTPIMWAGPVANWLQACDLIISLKPRAIVPGHGPLTDIDGVKKVQEYLRFVQVEARKRFDAGLGELDAAFDISLGDYSSWGDAERIVANVVALYREFRGDMGEPNIPAIFSMMATLERRGPRR